MSLLFYKSCLSLFCVLFFLCCFYSRALLLILMKGEMRGALKRIETQGQLFLAFCLSAEGFAYMPESNVLELKQPSHNNTNTYTWNVWPTSTQPYEGLASEWIFRLWKQKKATYCRRLCQHIPEQSIVSESLRWVRLKMHTAGKNRHQMYQNECCDEITFCDASIWK